MKFKRTLLAILLVVGVFAASVTVMAEFTKSFRTKRVISATASDGMLFSSNYLRENTGELNFSTIYVNRVEAEDPTNTYFDATVTIANYAQGNPTRFYRRAINYTITTSIVRLVTDGLGNMSTQTVVSGLPAVKWEGAALQASYSDTLAAGGAAENEYTLSLPRTMLTGEKLYVQLTATPTGGTYTDLAPITSLIELAIQPEASSTSWHIEGTDDRTNGVSEYAGYNFRLSGSGRGIIILGWDDTLFELNPVFLAKVGATTYTGSLPGSWSGLSAVSFSVDAANINSYDIQLYLRDPASVGSWSDVAMQMSFEENTASAEP